MKFTRTDRVLVKGIRRTRPKEKPRPSTREEYLAERQRLLGELRGLEEQMLYTKTQTRSARRVLSDFTIGEVLQLGLDMPQAQRTEVRLARNIRAIHARVTEMKARRRKERDQEGERIRTTFSGTTSDGTFFIGHGERPMTEEGKRALQNVMEAAAKQMREKPSGHVVGQNVPPHAFEGTAMFCAECGTRSSYKLHDGFPKARAVLIREQIDAHGIDDGDESP